MGNKNNVVDFGTHRRRQSIHSEQPQALDAPVLDITELRREMISEERRKVRRTILKEFFGAYIVIPGEGLQKVTIYDISQGGLSIDLPLSMGRFIEGEEIALRVYLSHQTYFPFTVKVQNGRLIEMEQVYRHGCSFQKDSTNEEATRSFVSFIENVTGILRTDKGDMVSSHSR